MIIWCYTIKEQKIDYKKKFKNEETNCQTICTNCCLGGWECLATIMVSTSTSGAAIGSLSIRESNHDENDDDCDYFLFFYSHLLWWLWSFLISLFLSFVIIVTISYFLIIFCRHSGRWWWLWDCQLERVFAEDSKQRERREALIKNYEDHHYHWL